MTKEEIDILWNKALRQSVDDGTLYTRYRFAELVAEAERDACAKVCEDAPEPDGRDLAERIRARSNT